VLHEKSRKIVIDERAEIYGKCSGLDGAEE
jgi:hypothetical protein